MTHAYFKSLDECHKKRYLEKLVWENEPLPDPLDEHLKRKLFIFKDFTLWPNIAFGDIYIYLVAKQCLYTNECFKNYKALDCYKYVLDGKVQDIGLYQNIQLQICIITCNVQASQALKKYYKPWAVVQCNGIIESAHCTCMEGLGEACSHIAALLLAIEIGIRDGLNRPSYTSQPCRWKKVTKKVPVIPASEICFTRKKKKLHNPNKKNSMNLPSDEAYKEFFSFIKKNVPDAPILTLMTDSEETDSSSEKEDTEAPK